LCTEAILAPNLVGSVPVAWAAGDERAAADAYTKIIGISAVNRWSAGSIRFTKAAMQALGLPGGYPRPPYLSLDDTSVDEIRKGLSDLGVPDLDALLSGATA
jgi:dihydrodipicolinate synthase/N-acetylneuraminate lyase